MLRALRSVGFLAFKEFWSAYTRPRPIIFLVLFGLTVLVFASSIGLTAATLSGPEVPPSAFPLWARSADGALAVLGLGVIPLLLPVFPIVMAYDSMARARSTGLLEMLMSRSIPRWRITIARFLGLFGAVAVFAVGILLGGVLLIQNAMGAAPDLPFILGLLAASLLLVALYLSLSLLFGTFLSPGTALGLSLLLWIGFQVLSPSAFQITGAMLTIVSLPEAALFQATWTDLLSFTGLHQGLMAVWVPPSLGIVVWPSADMWQELFTSWLVAIGGAPWSVGLVVLYAYFVGRMEVV